MVSPMSVNRVYSPRQGHDRFIKCGVHVRLRSLLHISLVVQDDVPPDFCHDFGVVPNMGWNLASRDNGIGSAMGHSERNCFIDLPLL